MKKVSLKNYPEYYLGLDIGTDSIGWAVTDFNYKLLRFNGKNMWGVRLFDGASDASARRANRASRRRLQRRKWRISLLKEIMGPAVNAVDENFFARLEDSNLYDGDKREATWFSLFSDKDFTDRDFHRKYKTIYHLRYAMMHETNPDPRLVYLALHHIIKYRGHFLLEGDFSAIDNISEPINAINAYLAEKDCDTFDMQKMEDFRIALTKKASKTVRSKEYSECFGVSGNKQLVAILDLIAGKKVNFKNLPVDCTENASITFDCDWDAKEAEIGTLLQDDFVLVENAKLLYDYAQLKSILSGYEYLSQAMIYKYEKHRDDLVALKSVMRKYFTKQHYDAMFKDAVNKSDTNYTAYSGKDNFSINKKDKREKLTVNSESRGYDEFIKYVKKVLLSNEQAQQDELTQQILADMDSGTFMPKQVSKNNSTLPYQLNLKELDVILNNICQFPRYSFLLQEDKNGLTAIQKIRSLLTFRIPYYVGPTNNHSGKYWIARKSDGKILPWNFSEIVDLEQSERNFVLQMTNECQYVPEAKALPKCSLLYEEYSFLNIVNKIKIDGNPIDVALKNKLSTYFALSGKNKLTKKLIKQWLVEENLIEANDSVVIEGFDDGATVHRRMYCQFVQILGSDKLVEQHRDKIEEIILDSTVAGSEKANLRKKLTHSYTFLTEEQIKRVVGLTCKGWGRFSKEFLTNRVGTNPITGEVNCYSVMDALRDTTLNLMEIYNSERFGFKQEFEKLQRQVSGEITYDVVDELYCSPSVKKQIWQALSIVKELQSVIGVAPKKIFVEVARDAKNSRDEERNRTISRYRQLQDIYEKLRAENRDIYNDDAYKHFTELDGKPHMLNSQKLFLYFLQNGVDIYTGEPIDYNHLELYDKDHIYPRSKIKDDSIHSNLVLTYRTQNASKTDVYPIAELTQTKMIGYWQALKKQGLMSDEKYKRLTRKTALTEDEMADFINRQLVETRQSTKETINLLRRLFPQSEIVFSKASNVSEFRARKNSLGEAQFVKSREMNDLHHAKDAYLNIVVGNVYNTRYGHDAHFWMRQPEARGYSDAKLFDYDVRTKDTVAWSAGEQGTIAQVQKVMRSNAVLFTRESRVSKGQLFNATLQPKGGKELVPLKGADSADRKFAKMSNTDKYGGYISESRVYYMFVKYIEQKHTKKGVKQTVKYQLLGVTAKNASTLSTPQAQKDYCIQKGLLNPQILISKIKVGTLFSFDRTLLSLSGMSGAQIVWRLAQQNTQENETVRYFKKVEDVVKASKKAQQNRQEYIVNDYDGVDKVRNKMLYQTFVDTLLSDRYSGASSLKSLGTKLSNVELVNRFEELSLTEQCIILVEIAKSLQCNASTSNLSLLGEGANCGKILTSCIFTSLDNICIVHRSISGLFEQKIPLVSFDVE